ncbi:MAG TPA: indole-3-glycerol phosphate synthase TrpC [Thiomicrospira sp.]|nr:indole-3-glycerol phosphate synthase TrpC [Thiomicrospira sp.]
MNSKHNTPDILKKIIFKKMEEIQAGCEKIPLREMKQKALMMSTESSQAKGFADAMQAKLDAGKSAVIAEIKKASPSKGILRDPFDPVEIAKSYQQHGAACLSVLTDKDFFQGSNQYLTQVREAVDIPIIRKDFIIDDYQVYEARVIGADCILLIAAAIGDAQMYELTQTALTLGMDVLIEVHNEEEMERALRLPLPMIGINNRDLHSFEVSLETTIRMLDMIEDERIIITESGILTKEDVLKMRENSVNSFLVGETFMRAENPGEKLAELFD